jgi:hypothetical protein
MSRQEVRLSIEDVQQMVKSRYGQFAETGGRKEPC